MQAKTMAVFAILIAVGFVAANSIIPQAPAQQFCVDKKGRDSQWRMPSRAQ